MSTFTIPDEFDGLRIYAGGSNFEFDGTVLEVETEADAKRVRRFAVENPQWGIQEDGETVTRTAYFAEPEAHGDVVAEDAGQDAPTDPQGDAEGAGALEGADAPPADTATDGDAPDADPADEPSEPEPAPAPARRRRARA